MWPSGSEISSELWRTRCICLVFIAKILTDQFQHQGRTEVSRLVELGIQFSFYWSLYVYILFTRGKLCNGALF